MKRLLLQILALGAFWFCVLFNGAAFAQGFTLNGTATSLGGDCFQLTANTTGQNGTVWFSSLLDLTQPFDINLEMYFGTSDGGADGMVFVLQDVGPTAIGLSGGGIGYAGFAPSLGVEFDTWPNSSDPSADHIGIQRDGNTDHFSPLSLDGPFTLPNIEDGNWHDVRITWDPAINQMRVFFDCALITTFNYDIINLIFGGDPNVYWGFTGATGGFSNFHRVCLTAEFIPLADTAYNCFGDSVELTATGAGPGGTYTWTPNYFIDDTNSATPKVNPPVDTTYYVSYLDPCGLLVTDSIRVIASVPPPIDLGPDTVLCVFDTLTLDATSPGFSYTWSNGAATPTVEADSSGNWWVEVDDGLCSARDTINILYETTIPVEIGSDTTICHGTTIPLDVSGTGASYLWSTGQTAGIIGVSVADTYWVEVTSPAGCIGRDTIVIDTFTLDLIPTITHPSCNGDADGEISVLAAGGFPPYTYSWESGGSLSIESGLSAGPWGLTVTDGSGCQGLIAGSLIDPPLLTAISAATLDDCNTAAGDGTIEVTPQGGTPGYSYVWNTIPIQTSATAIGLSPGTYTCTVTDLNGCTTTVTDVVTMLPKPVVSLGPSLSFCEGGAGVELSSTVSGGTGVYFYTWSCSSSPSCGIDSLFDDDPQVLPGASSWYFMHVTDANGCRSDSDSVWVEVIPKPIVDAGPDRFICADSAPCEVLMGSVVSGVGPYIYTWVPSDGLNTDDIPNPCARPDTTTIYTLIVSDLGTGCTSDATTLDTNSTTTVHVQNRPVADAGPDIDLCFGDTIMLSALGTGAGPVYDYEWSPTTGILGSPTDPNPLFSPPTTTSYTLTVNSNGCPSFGDTVTINVHTRPTAAVPVDFDICLGDTTELIGDADGDPGLPGYTFSWSPSMGVIGDTAMKDIMVSPDTLTTYYLTVTSDWGCESEPTPVTVYHKPTPIADAGPDLFICGDDSVQLLGQIGFGTSPPAPDPTAIIINWSPPTDLSGTDIIQPMADPTLTSTYTLTLSYNTCSTSDEVIVHIVPELGANIIGDTNVICSGDTLVLTAEGGISAPAYSWTPAISVDPSDGNPVNVFPDTTTTYTVVLSESGCTDTAEYEVAVIPSPDAAFIASNQVGCAPFTVSFTETSTHALNWHWDFGDGTPLVNIPHPVHTYSQPGLYAVNLTAMNVGGCSGEADEMIIEVRDGPEASFITDPFTPARLAAPETKVEVTNTSQDIVDWLWDFGNGMTSKEWNSSIQYQEEGTFFIKLWVQDGLGCSDTMELGPIIIESPELFIPNVFTPNGDGYQDEFLPVYTGTQPYQLRVIDRWGAQIYHSKDKSSGWNGARDKGKPMPEGVYYYILTIGNKEYTGDLTLMR